jgi:hypothetical protein
MSIVPSSSSLNPLGPGEYSETSYDQHHSSWAKCERFAQGKPKLSILGPGSYDSK